MHMHLCMDRCSCIYMHVFVSICFNIVCVLCSIYFITPVAKCCPSRQPSDLGISIGTMCLHHMELERQSKEEPESLVTSITVTCPSLHPK